MKYCEIQTPIGIAWHRVLPPEGLEPEARVLALVATRIQILAAFEWEKFISS